MSSTQEGQSTAAKIAYHLFNPKAYLPGGVAAIVAGGYLLAYGIVSWYTERAYKNLTGRQRETSFIMNALSIALAAAAIVAGVVLIFLWNSNRKIPN